MDIHLCTLADLEALTALSRAAYADHYTYLWWDAGAKYMERNFNTTQLRTELTNTNARFFLIRSEETDVGMLKLNLDNPTNDFDAADALEIERIYFLKSAIGKGLGKKTINFALDLARERGKKIVWLKTMQSSDAVGFYQQCGFEIVGESTLDYVEMKDEFRKMFLMYLHL